MAGIRTCTPGRPPDGWDQANTAHIASYQVTPEEVEQVFANDEMDIDYDVIGGEERWTVIGQTDRARVLIVVFTMRADAVSSGDGLRGERTNAN